MYIVHRYMCQLLSSSVRGQIGARVEAEEEEDASDGPRIEVVNSISFPASLHSVVFLQDEVD